jgi:DNA mismatch endonuclease (patch repair protein)
MSQIRSKGNRDTEIRFRAILLRNKIHGWRRHLPLPGKPDFSFPDQRVAVFVDGCFWHGCAKCYRAPKSNQSYWSAKIDRNRARDKKAATALRRQNWRVLRFWECSLSNDEQVKKRLLRALGSKNA